VQQIAETILNGCVSLDRDGCHHHPQSSAPEPLSYLRAIVRVGPFCRRLGNISLRNSQAAGLHIGLYGPCLPKSRPRAVDAAKLHPFLTSTSREELRGLPTPFKQPTAQVKAQRGL